MTNSDTMPKSHWCFQCNEFKEEKEYNRFPEVLVTYQDTRGNKHSLPSHTCPHCGNYLGVNHKIVRVVAVTPR
jgi:hypothetical protein